MIGRINTVIIAGVILVNGALIPAAEPATRPATFTLAGRAIDVGSGKPAQRISVTGWSWHARGRNVPAEPIAFVTGENGEFSVNVRARATVQSLRWDDSPDGSYLIDDEWQSAGNWEALGQLVMTQDRKNLVLRIKLVPSVPLKGKVVDEQGKPAIGVSVYVGPPQSPAITNKEGEFVLKAVPKNRDFDLVAVREGSSFFGMNLSRTIGGIAHLKAGSTEATITVRPARRFEGQVTNAAGLPAGGLTFTMMPTLGSKRLYMGELMRTAVTDSDGKSSIRNLLGDCVYEISWSQGNENNRDYDNASMLFDLSKVQAGEPIRFEATQYLNTIMGKVVDEKGEGLKGAVIQIKGSNILPRDAWQGPMVTTDEKGEFEIQRLAHGKVQLHIHRPGYKLQWVTAPTDSVDFKAVLKKAEGKCQCRLVVVDEAGKPIAGAPASVKGMGRVPDMTAKTDDAGLARLELPLVAEANGYEAVTAICDLEGRDLAVGSLTLNEDAEVRLVAGKSGRTWRGRVVDDEGKALAGANVAVTMVQLGAAEAWGPRSAVVEQLNISGLYPPTVTDAEGRFDLRRLGAYAAVQLQLTAPGHITPYAAFSAEARDQEKEFVLPLACQVKGKVVLKGAGKAPPEQPAMTVFLQPTGGPGMYPQMQVANDWQFSSGAVAVGMYQAQIRANDVKSAKYVCEAPPSVLVSRGEPTEVVIEVEEGIRVFGKLVDAKTEKPLQGQIVLNMIGGGESPASGQTGTDQDGKWQIYVPREGEYQVQYYVQGMASFKQYNGVTVKRGRDVELIIRAETE